MCDAPVLTTHHLEYTIGSARLLNGVNLSLCPGELRGLIGPNGAGKSTLLRNLVGFLKPSGGEVRIEGRPLNTYTARERARRVSYLSQHGPDQFPFPVVEVVEMGSYPVIGMGRAPGQAEREAALRALAYVGLEHLADRSFPSLSGGERQLALFARVLVQQSPIILLDEPTASLDIGHETTLLRMVRDLCAEGYSAVVALHNLNLAAEYCRTVTLMHNGRVRADGPPEEVLSRALIEECYETQVHVGRNEATGSVAVSPLSPTTSTKPLRVHVVGGAGGAVNITRFLHRNGFGVSGGVAHDLDADARLWGALAIPFVHVPPFATIDNDAFDRAAQMVDTADVTVLCAFPFGQGNARNIELAQRAGRLIILREQEGDGRRDFFGEAESVRPLFDRLVERHGIVSYRDACTMLERSARDETAQVAKGAETTAKAGGAEGVGAPEEAKETEEDRE